MRRREEEREGWKSGRNGRDRRGSEGKWEIRVSRVKIEGEI